MQQGDICSIFTPDDSHYEIAKYAISRGLHCMVTKPVVMKLDDHLELVKLSHENNVLVQVEVHKR